MEERPDVQKMIAGPSISACDIMRRWRLVKATATLEAQGCHDGRRTGQGDSKRLEWLPLEWVGELKGAKLWASLGIGFQAYSNPVASSGRRLRRTWNSDEVFHESWTKQDFRLSFADLALLPYQSRINMEENTVRQL